MQSSSCECCCWWQFKLLQVVSLNKAILFRADSMKCHLFFFSFLTTSVCRCNKSWQFLLCVPVKCHNSVLCKHQTRISISSDFACVDDKRIFIYDCHEIRNQNKPSFFGSFIRENGNDNDLQRCEGKRKSFSCISNWNHICVHKHKRNPRHVISLFCALEMIVIYRRQKL